MDKTQEDESARFLFLCKDNLRIWTRSLPHVSERDLLRLTWDSSGAAVMLALRPL